MTDNRFNSPEAQTIRSLMRKVDEEVYRADSAEWNEDLYRTAFKYLNRQAWFKEHSHKLHDYISRVLEARREIINPKS